MSNNWVKDIHDMHAKFGVHEAVNKLDTEKLRTFLDFRLKCVGEEYEETLNAIEEGNSEEIVDGLIDLCVFAIGTLDLYGIDANKAWDQVLNANLNKEVGVKPGRPNPYKLPDLLKPEGWTGPDHSDNHGKIPEIFKK